MRAHLAFIIVIIAAVLLARPSHSSPRDRWHTPIFVAASLNLLCRQAISDHGPKPQVWAIVLNTARRDLAEWQPAGEIAPIKAGLWQDMERLRNAGGNWKEECGQVQVSLESIRGQARQDGLTGEEMAAIFDGTSRSVY